MAKTLEESWELSSGDTTAIPAANRHDGVDAGWADIWEYQVPSGQAHILKSGHHVAFYIDDTVGAGTSEATAGKCRLEIVVKDQSKQDGRVIFGPALYDACKDFNDMDKMAKLKLPSDLVVEERFWIVIRGISDTAIDESDSYFSLETIRVRSGI